MKILWLTWKDMRHPQAGGAEVVNEELAKRLVKDGHEVIFLTAMFPGAAREEVRDAVPAGRQGFSIVRVGGRFSVYWEAYQHYKQHLALWPDLVVDEMNTIPFFAKFYAKQKNILFVHQLCREIWFYQMPFPLSLIGYLVEPLYLWLLNDRETVTVSESTKKDLMRFGFKAEKIHVISEGIELEPVATLAGAEKYPEPTILAHGAVRPMKRTLHILRAFNTIKLSSPTARLIISGDIAGAYGARVLRAVAASPFKKDIEVKGRISDDEKFELLGFCHLLLATSVKEGWGIVVTEANSRGTPAIVYDVDGLRDSVKNGETGIVCAKNTPECLAENILKLLGDVAYEKLRRNAWEWSKEITFDNAYRQFSEILNKYV